MTTSPSRRRLLVATGTSTVALALAVTAPASALASTHTAFGGSAYGSTVAVGSLATSGTTSYTTLCTTRTGEVARNNTAAVDRPGVAHIGAATTTVSSVKGTSSVSSVSTSRTGATSLLGGLVRASALTSSAKVTRTSTSTYHRTGSAVFTGLRVAGVAVKAKPGANDTITIPHIATVRLNGQYAATTAGSHTLTVTALRVTLLKGNPLDLPVGTIVVGVAAADLHAPTHRLPAGIAFGTRVDAGGVVTSGATAAVGLPCGGSSTARTNHVGAVDVPAAVHAGAVTTSVKSSDSATKTVSATSATIAGVRLLGGVVTVDAVTVAATTTRTSSAVTRSSAGTSIVGLNINGVPQTVGSAENSTVHIAGVGTLVLHGTVRTSSGLQVYGLQLNLDTAVGGLTRGTILTVAAARSSVASR